MEKTVYLVGGNKEVTAYIPKTVDVHNLEIKYNILQCRITKHKWSIEKAFTQPVKRREKDVNVAL